MASVKDFATLLREHERKRLGTSADRLGKLTVQADIDLAADNLKAGPPIARMRNGLFYGGEGVVDTLLLTEDVMVLGPIIIESFAVIEEIGIDVTTAGTEGNLYTALYRDRGDGYPGAKVHASAALAVTAGFKSTTALSIPLTPGIYWGGALCNQVTTTVATVRSLINNSRYVGASAGADDVNRGGYSQAALTGVPPAAFTDTATVVAEAPSLLLKVKNS